MEEKKTENQQIIIHKSDWGGQVIKVLIFVIVVGFTIKSNPSKNDFVKEAIYQYSLNKGKLDISTSSFLGEFGSNAVGGILEPFVRRRDFLLFSTYEVGYENDEYKISISAWGIWNNIFFDEENSILKKKDPANLFEDYKRKPLEEYEYGVPDAVDTTASPIDTFAQ